MLEALFMAAAILLT